MANLITIDQLLESVDLDFEPRWVTKDENRTIYIWADKPEIEENIWDAPLSVHGTGFGELKLSEFDGKDWTECIYEVPRKVEVTKIEEFTREDFETIPDGHGNYKKVLGTRILDKLNQVVDAINELKGVNND